MTKMNKIFEELEYRISQANNSGAYAKVKDILESISGNVLVVGAGGSYAAADYISKCLKCFAVPIHPRDISFQKLDLVDYIILVTYSGKTPDIIHCINQCREYKNIKKIFAIAWDGEALREKIKNENVEIIQYKNEDTKEDSFISVASTLAPASLMARYFAEKKGYDFDSYLKDLLIRAENEVVENIEGIDFNALKENTSVEVIYEGESKSSAAMLESNFTETGFLYSVFHEKKDFSHGRHSLNYKKSTPILIWLKNSTESEYDKELKSYLNCAWSSERLLMIESVEKGLLGEFEMMVKGMYLTKFFAEKLGLDICEPDYDARANKLYSFNRELI